MNESVVWQLYLQVIKPGMSFLMPSMLSSHDPCVCTRPPSDVTHSLGAIHLFGGGGDSHWVETASTISQPPKSWDYKGMPSCLASSICNVRSGDQTEALRLARQALYQLSEVPEATTTGLGLSSSYPRERHCSAQLRLIWHPFFPGATWMEEGAAFLLKQSMLFSLGVSIIV